MMMRFFRSVCVLAILAAACAYGAGANAQGTDAERQACTPDAMRLCGDAIPDVAKVTACMKAKYSQLSEPCRVAMRAGRKAVPRHHHYYKHHYHHYH